MICVRASWWDRRCDENCAITSCAISSFALADFKQARQTILDGLKFSRDDATDFASKIIHATVNIQKDYVKETKQGDLVGWAIRGLYQAGSATHGGGGVTGIPGRNVVHQILADRRAARWRHRLPTRSG